MNVLSVFDGLSAGRIALDRLGVKCKYYASEIDKYAIEIAQKNYPDTIQLGDIRFVHADRLPKIDLLIGGSPCQGFSVSGKRLNFKDPRSQLFFEYIRLLKELKPKYFLLENVAMKKEIRDIISAEIGVEPILINSSLVSAQNRKRLYWTNLPTSQPEDKKIYLKDIIEYGMVDRDKSHCLDSSYYKGGHLQLYFEKHRRQVVFDCAMLTEMRTEEAKMLRRKIRKETGKDWSPRRAKSLVARTDGKSNCITTGLTREHIVVFDQCVQTGVADLNGHDILKRTYSISGKSPTLNACTGGNREPKITLSRHHWRKLTPVECERLQTIPDDYTAGVSNTQRYKMLGNSFTVDVIVHILKNMK